MRILLCHNFYQQPGGEDQVFADEGQLLESRGHEVIRFTRHNDEIKSMGNWQILRSTLWNGETRRDLSDLIRRARPDVLHCHNTFPLLSPSIYAAANEAGVPVVQTLHNFRLLCPSALFLRDGRPCEDCMGKLLAWPGIVHGCYRGNRSATTVVAAMLAVHRVRGTWLHRVGQFIALSEFSRCKFIQGGLPAERIAVKANCMPHDPLPGRGAGGYAIFAGRLAPEKGVALLLDAWRRLKTPLPLKIVGDGPLLEEVRAAAAAADSRIEYLGQRPTAEVLALVGEAEFLVVPSICYENCPKTVVEAFSKGTPVVGARMGAMQEMVEHGRNGWLFESGKAEDLVRTIDEAAVVSGASSSRTQTGQAMRQAARSAFEEKYTPDANYARLIEIYRCAGACSLENDAEPRHSAVRAPHVLETVPQESSFCSAKTTGPVSGIASVGNPSNYP